MTHKRGTSIIEIVIATALISVAIISALSLANHSQKQNTYARNLDEATKYGSEAIDWIRTQRDSLGWATIANKAQTDDVSGVATYCLASLPESGAGDFSDLTAGTCASDTFIPGTRYGREMTIDTSQAGTGTLTVAVTMTWLEQSPRTAYIETELTSWR